MHHDIQQLINFLLPIYTRYKTFYFFPDINECEENTHDCEMTCTNSAGSFVCECMDGYRLDDNMRNCSGMLMSV